MISRFRFKSSSFFLLAAALVSWSCAAPPDDTDTDDAPLGQVQPAPTLYARIPQNQAPESDAPIADAPEDEPSQNASPNNAIPDAPEDEAGGVAAPNGNAVPNTDEPTPMPQMVENATTEIRALAEMRPPRAPAPQPGPNFGVARALAISPDFQPLPLRLPSPPTRATLPPDARIAAIEAKNRKFPTFEAFRQLAALHLSRGEYEAAIATFKTQAQMYRARGKTDAATIQDLYAARYTTDARAFLERAATPSDIARLSTNAPAEPPVGCYAGAFIDRDDGLGRGFLDEVWTTHRNPDAWTQLTGKAHGSLWMYHAYGRPAPMTWLRLCKSRGIVPHLAWEPQSMTQVNDDAYLRSFARDLKRLNWPVLIRFASEMNGRWTPYHQNAALYRQKFRVFYNVIHREAPNCAVVWCVANPPLENVDAYYPGDDACDWVGVNFYAVPFYENNPNRPAFEDNPLALLDAIYRKYSARKPIAVCEFAASHQAGLDKIKRPSFAQEKMSLIYGALPLLYPRVKLMDWFSMNTIRYSAPGKTASNYALSESAPTLQTYRALVNDSWFLSRRAIELDTPPVCVPLSTGAVMQGRARLHLWAKTYTPRPQVMLTANGRVLYAARRYGPHTLELDTSKLPVGATNLALLLYDDRNRFIRAQRINVTVAR